MKTEIINVPGKGICILISGFSPTDLNQIVGAQTVPVVEGYRWTDLTVIALAIREGKKIQGIKEIRHQTGMGLKEAKEYIERYMPYGLDYQNNTHACERAAEQFIKDHTLENFLGDGDFNV